MDEFRQTPTDRLYRNGVPINVPRNIDSSIDWKQRRDDPQNVQNAATAATSHYHYEGVSHLLLCRQIQCQTTAPEIDALADHITQHTQEAAGAWGKYIAQVGHGSAVSPEIRDFYTLLFQEADPLPVMLAITTLDTANHAVFQETQGDDLYRSVTGVITDIREDHLPQRKDRLHPIILDKTIAERRDLLRTLAQYIDLVGMTVARHDATFQHLGTSDDQILASISDDVKQFYRDIGLTDDIF